MYDILFYNGTILAADGPIANGYVAVKDGIIASIGKGNPSGIDAVKSVDLEGNILSPGFIDIHTHGAGGSDFMDGTADAIVTAARMHLRHGTTTICPTSVTCDDEELFTFMDCYQHAKSIRENMPHLAGIHLEGPYLSPGQAGAQQSDQMKRPLPEHYMKILEKSRGNIIRWSSAPEIPGVIEFGDILEKHGIIPSIAHTDADLFTVKRAMEHGYSILTHFYSGMSQMKRVNGYRIPGVVEAGYLYDDLYVEIIADGIHLPKELLQLIVKCKPHDHIILVTDSMRAAGMPDGPSVLGSIKNNFRVIVEDGVAKMPDRQSFAGSVATADRLVRVMVFEAGLPLHEAVDMITKNPAKLLRIDHKTGSIAEGKTADLVVFSEDIEIQQVYVEGEMVNI